MFYKIKFSIILLVAVLFIAGCGSNSGEDERQKDVENFVASTQYIIDQTDTRKGTVQMPGSYLGSSGYYNINADVNLKSTGKMIENDISGSYLGKWEVKYVYTEKWESLLLNLQPFGQCTVSSNLIKYTATLTFDLAKVDKTDNSFTATVSNFTSDNGKMTMLCQVGPQVTVDPPVVFNAGTTIKGKISNFNANSATLEFSSDYIFNSYNFTSDYYRKLDKPITLQIKFADN